MATDDDMMNTSEPPGELTWAWLLASWARLAQASVALPRDDTGDRWRASIASIVGLQACTHALGDLERLPRDERLLGLDRAAVVIDRHAGELARVWEGSLPESLAELRGDARRALAAAEALWRPAPARPDDGEVGAGDDRR